MWYDMIGQILFDQCQTLAAPPFLVAKNGLELSARHTNLPR